MIYADIDLNIIDGSSVWVTSIVETLAQNEKVQPTLLLKRPVKRETLLKSLRLLSNVSILDPWSKRFRSLQHSVSDTSWVSRKRLSPEQAAQIIEKLDAENHYDFILVRGFSLSREIAYHYRYASKTWFYITDFPQNIEDVTETDLDDLITIYKNGGKLACQTPDLIQYFKELLNVWNDGKFLYLPPMIPNFQADERDFKNKNNRLIYAGKFAPLWKVPEMFEAFAKIKDPSLEFMVVGDKFHNYPYIEDYEKKVRETLESVDNIVWRKGLSRQEVQLCIMNSDVGISWRHESMDESKELSTKVLEYGLYGKPVILNRNALHEDLFGNDYPLFANSEKEFIEKIKLAFHDPDVYRKAAEKVFAVSQRHTFSKVSQYLKPYIEHSTHNKKIAREDRPIHLLFAGHDLKFARTIINFFKVHPRFEVRLDQWQGHNKHDEAKSKCLLNWADVIVAEWGLGNAVWYSNHKKAEQKLIVRMHLQEKNTPFPRQIKWKNIDRIIFIAPGLKEDLSNHFKFPADKATVIYNVVDTSVLSKEKLPGYQFNLGFMGICPKRKRLDYTIEIFKKLWFKDPRYTLYVKGKLPNEYPWLWKRDEERKYYMQLFKEINRSPYRDAVVFEGWGKNVSEWFRKIGFILSTSDFESFHLSVAEGMASGAVPVIRDWFGASMLYPNQFIIESVDEGVELIQKCTADPDLYLIQQEARNYIRERYDKSVICKKWEEMIMSLVNKN